MTTVSATEQCRLTVCGPDSQIEVAVPAHVSVADLLPALLSHLGDNLADSGLLHGGWVLQRLGSTPFDEDSTVASLKLRDGDTIHLRPRSEQIPPVAFDDLIDGVAAGVRNRSGRWRPEMTRWMALGLLAVLLATGLAVLAMPGPGQLRAVVAAGIAVCCLISAFVAAEAKHDRLLGTGLAVAAVGYAGLAGVIAADPGTPIGLTPVEPQVFTGVVAMLATVALAAILINAARPFFTGVLTATVVSAGGFALATFIPLTLAQAAAVIAVVSPVVATVVPLLAFRLAGLRLAPLPTVPEHLQEDLDPEPSEPLLAKSATADRYMTAIHFGLAVPAAASLVIVSRLPGWLPVTLVVLVAVVRGLAARPMTSGWHRLATISPGVAGLVGATVATAISQPPLRLWLSIVVVPLGAIVLIAASRVMPERRLMPYWGRIGDFAQTAAMITTLPVLLGVLGVYDFARAIGG